MQAIMETLFDAAYLVTVVTLGCIMVKSAQDRETKLFGWMAVILGCGDAFHLVPRAWALCTDGLAAHAAALGAGKFITSITMTIFYVILYHIGKRRYGLHIRALTGAVYALAAARIGLCLFPQNAWLSANPPLSWGIWRNVPFALLGALVIVVFLRGARQTGGQGLPLDVAGHRAQLRVLYPGGAVGRRRSARGHAHDPQYLRLCVGGLDAVSYTHLDVYKRQGLTRPPVK